MTHARTVKLQMAELRHLRDEIEQLREQNRQFNAALNQALSAMGKAEAERDAALAVLQEALDQSNCDGDLCLYAWHDKARRLLSPKEPTKEPARGLNMKGGE